jgi:hypothetical protein
VFEPCCASTYLTPHWAIDRPKIICGYNARRRVHGLRATLEQEKSRKVRMIEAIQESRLLQSVEYSDAQIKNTIIIQNWIRDILKKMQARVKFKRGANCLHNVQAGIFHVQQEVHTRLLLSSLQVTSLFTIVAEPYKPVELIDIYIYMIIVYNIFLS